MDQLFRANPLCAEAWARLAAVKAVRGRSARLVAWSRQSRHRGRAGGGAVVRLIGTFAPFRAPVVPPKVAEQNTTTYDTTTYDTH